MRKKGETVMKAKRIWALGTLVLVAALLISSVALAGGPTSSDDGKIKVKVATRGGPLHGANGLYFGPEGNLYIASAMGREIVVMDPEDGQILDRIGPEYAAGMPDDLTFGPDGALYWTAIWSGDVMKRAPGCTPVSIANLGLGVNAITFSDDGRLFVALDFYGVGLYEIDPDGVNPPRVILPNVVNLNGFDFGPHGLLYGPLFGQEIVRVDVDAATVETVADFPGAAVKFDSHGRLHAVAQDTGQVARIDTKTGAIQVIATLHDGLDNLAFGAHDRLYVSNADDGDIVEVMKNGRVRTVSPGGLIVASGVAIAPEAPGEESVWVADYWSLRHYTGHSGRLLSQQRASVIGSRMQPFIIAMDGDRAIVSSWVLSAVQVWDPMTGDILAYYSIPNIPMNAIPFQGDLVIAELMSGQVVRMDSSGSSAPIGQFAVPVGLAATDNDLWAGDFWMGTVSQLVRDGVLLDPPSVVASGLVGPEGLAVGQDGNLLVVESTAGRLSRIDLVTGQVSTLMEGLQFLPATPADVPTLAFNGVAVAPSGAIYVTEDGTNTLYRITVLP
jgi:sugar lactone lactonase YvrE